jgi:hypothetical protein
MSLVYEGNNRGGKREKERRRKGEKEKGREEEERRRNAKVDVRVSFLSTANPCPVVSCREQQRPLPKCGVLS